MNQSNSGGSACGATQNGVRKEGVDIVVDQLRGRPGLDGFCIAWTYAGGEIRNGQLVGTCERLPPDKFAMVLSMQKRVIDAKAKGLIEVCSSRVVQRKHSNGKVIHTETYKLPGSVPVGASLSRPDQLPPREPRVVIDVLFYPEIKSVTDFKSLRGLLD